MATIPKGATVTIGSTTPASDTTRLPVPGGAKPPSGSEAGPLEKFVYNDAMVPRS